MTKGAKGKRIDPHGALLEPLWSLSARPPWRFIGLETEIKSLSASCVAADQE
jgi:hypothetical protein